MGRRAAADLLRPKALGPDHRPSAHGSLSGAPTSLDHPPEIAAVTIRDLRCDRRQSRTTALCSLFASSRSEVCGCTSKGAVLPSWLQPPPPNPMLAHLGTIDDSLQSSVHIASALPLPVRRGVCESVQPLFWLAGLNDARSWFGCCCDDMQVMARVPLSTVRPQLPQLYRVVGRRRKSTL